MTGGEETGSFDKLQHLKSGHKDESYSLSLFCFNYTVVRKSPFTQKSNAFLLVQFCITPKELGVNFHQKCERRPSQSNIYLQDINHLPRRSKRIFIMGLSQSPVNLAVFMSLIGKIQANDRARQLEQ